GELDQDVAGRGRVEERDARAAMADPRRLVAQLHTLLPKLGESAIDVLDLEADVEEAGALLVDPLPHTGFGPLPFQELELRLADREHREPRLADLLFVLERDSERVAEQVDGLPERIDRDRDVFHALDLHVSVPHSGNVR